MGNINLEERVAKARRLFKEEGYNCCQSVVLAYNDIFGIPDEVAASMASGFGGGMGRLREVCGSVSGMVLLAGFLSPATDPKNMEGRTKNYALVQELAGKSKEINGSIICRELLKGETASQKDKQESPTPSDRTPEYYKKRPCEELVGISARIIGEKIIEKFE